MRYLSKILWMPVLVLHTYYVLITFKIFPQVVGVSASAPPTYFGNFLLEWFFILGGTNLFLGYVYFVIPKMKDTMLNVPGRKYWLKDNNTRMELNDRIRQIIEIAFLCLNVFFFAIYQSIYQTNVIAPKVKIPGEILQWVFMGGSMFLLISFTIFAVARMKIISRGK